MKNRRRIPALLLTVVLLVSLFPVSAFAAEEKYMEFDGVFTLGDSNAMAYGLPGYKGGQVDENGTLIKGTEFTDLSYLHCVPGSFQDVVRQGLGLPWESTWSMNYPALRVHDALFYLDGCEVDEYHALAYDYRVKNVESDAYGEKFVYDPSGTAVDPSESVFIDRLQSFDHPLIINQLGNADIFYSMMELAIKELSGLDEDGAAAVIGNTLELFWEKHSEFRKEYPMLIERLQELSPNGVIVLVGMFNSVKDLVITDEVALPLFNALQLLFDQINSDIQSFAKQYGCLYANIDNAETLTSVFEYSVEDILNGGDLEKVYHASPEGYAYIGRQILRQVELNSCRHLGAIVADLGPVREVSSVLLDGKAVTNWTYDKAAHELTVPCLTTLAKTLTVTERRDNGTYVSVYSLSWTLRDGYTAKQLYTTQDAAATGVSLTKTAVSVIKTVASAVKNVFGKLRK